MVALSQIRHSNSLIASTLPPGTVSIFAGATHGIGEYSLLQFVKASTKPKIYFLGRSEESGKRVAEACRQLNPDGEYIFMKADLSLLSTVDAVCETIKQKEKHINLLFMSQGLITREDTSEGLPLIMAVTYYCKIRIILNLIPLLSSAPSPGIRRIVIPFTGGKEGKMCQDDWQFRKLSPLNILAARSHSSSMVTLALHHIAQSYPEVSFVHNYPGSVKTNLLDSHKGVGWAVLKTLLSIAVRFTPNDECGERHTFFATSSRFPPRNGEDGVTLGENVRVAKGIDGIDGSGTYTVEESGEIAKSNVLSLLQDYIKDGTQERLWAHTMGEFRRISGKEHI